MRREEKGITLIALIITIIILVILAAVSIRAVTNLKIVDYAVNGAENYAKVGKTENKTLDDTVSFIDEAVAKVKKASEDTDDSEKLLAYLNSDEAKNAGPDDKLMLDGIEVLNLGPDFNDDMTDYWLYKGKIYKSILDGRMGPVTSVTLTNKDASKLGYNETNNTLTTVNGTYTEKVYEPKETDGFSITTFHTERAYIVKNSDRSCECTYNNAGICLNTVFHLV